MSPTERVYEKRWEYNAVKFLTRAYKLVQQRNLDAALRHIDLVKSMLEIRGSAVVAYSLATAEEWISQEWPDTIDLVNLWLRE